VGSGQDSLRVFSCPSPNGGVFAKKPIKPITPGHARTSFPMPTLSRFYGITITLRPREANHPRAHFHASYAEFEASIAMDNFQILNGFLPRRALELTIAWAVLHRAELLAGWQTMRAGQLPDKIEPLE